MNKKVGVGALLVLVVSTVFCSSVLWGGHWYELSGGEPAEETLTSAEQKTDSKSSEKPVIVIDAGHGGVDMGASADDGTSERDINLAIALKLKEKIEKYPAKVVLTRENDEELLEGYDGNGGRKRYDMESRKSIIDKSNPTLTVSIHLNSFPQDSSVCGPQVFYPQVHKGSTINTTENDGILSETFAKNVQNALKNNIETAVGKEAKTKNDIYLFKNIDSSIILVECGFLSNPEDRERLKTAEYQEVLADAIWEGINEYLCLKQSEPIKITESANRDEKRLKNLWITSS